MKETSGLCSNAPPVISDDASMLHLLRIAVTALSLTACVLLIPFGIGTPELVIIGIIAIILFVGSQFPPVGGAKAPK